MVTADARLPRAASDEHPDPFWAIRGGGDNSGAVTAFEFAPHEDGPVVQFGMFFWGLDQGPAGLRLIREIVGGMPAGINAVAGAVNAPPAPFVPGQHHVAPGYVLLPTVFGSPKECERSSPRSTAACRRRSTWSPRCPMSSWGSCSTRPTPGFAGTPRRQDLLAAKTY